MSSFQSNPLGFSILVADESHVNFAVSISELLKASASEANSGLAVRTPEYLADKMRQQKAVIALHRDTEVAGFCYIETWSHRRYVANSGLVVDPRFRGQKLGWQLKQAAFELSRQKFPEANIFSITTSHAVMKMNSELGFRPVPFSELTADDEFWDGCKTCNHYDILTRNQRSNCLCTGLLYRSKQTPKPRAKTSRKRMVLAFSGGLDTSYCLRMLSENPDVEIDSVTVNTGGFGTSELLALKEKAMALGAARHIVLDQIDSFYRRCIRYLIYGNVLKNHTYPLSVSSERAFQAFAIARYARRNGIKTIIHGSTGAGNDQVRFDMIFNAMIPDAEIITPIRDHQLSREEEIQFLEDRGMKEDWRKATKYSINQGLWGTSVGGAETLTSDQNLPEEAYPTALQEKEPMELTLVFEYGEPKQIGEERFDNPVHAIQHLQNIAGRYAIGRDIHVGDTLIGIKGRVGFEAAAPLIIIKAHQHLEKHVLTKWQLYWKDQLANWYGNLLHDGHFMDPIMRNIEHFMEDTQKVVNGEVRVMLAPYRFQVLGIRSDHDLMNSDFASYGEMNHAWSGKDVRGFAKILSNQSRIYQHVNGDREGE